MKLKRFIIGFIWASLFLVNLSYAGTFLDQELTEENIIEDFGLGKGEKINSEVMKNFLIKKLKIRPFDAKESGYIKWGETGRVGEGFVPDPLRIKLLKNILKKTGMALDPSKGMTPKQYLIYLRISFGDLTTLPLTNVTMVKDFLVGLVINLNPIFNLRTNDNVDDKYNNVLSIHRESIAYRLVFDYIGKRYYRDSIGGDPLKQVILNETIHGQLLSQILGSGDNLKNYLITMGIDKTLADTVMHQFEGIKEERLNSNGNFKVYKFGIKSFLLGEVESRIDQKYYLGESAVWYRIEELCPNIDLKGELNWDQIYALINVIGSFPDNVPYYKVIGTSAPYDKSSPYATGSDLMEFFVALGNALPNKPGAPFADLIPIMDINAMEEAGIWNAEFEYHRLAIPNIYNILNIGYIGLK